MKEKGSKYSEYGELLRDSIKIIEEAKDSLRHLSRELCLFIKFFHENLLQFI